MSQSETPGVTLTYEEAMAINALLFNVTNLPVMITKGLMHDVNRVHLADVLTKLLDLFLSAEGKNEKA